MSIFLCSVEWIVAAIRYLEDDHEPMRPWNAPVHRSRARAVICAGVFGIGLTSTAHAVPSAERSFAFALVGDAPYGQRNVLKFDRLIDEINSDRDIRFVMHAGDIKSGRERCDDPLIQKRFQQFQRFRPAFVFTPGDNDWTDCHRISAGGYDPIERLQFLRRLFFPNPNLTTGRRPLAVVSQGSVGRSNPFVENVMFSVGSVVFGTIHVVGSNNGLDPWREIDPKDSFEQPRADRIGEFSRRQSAALRWLRYLFEHAENTGSHAVFILIHANPRFDLGPQEPNRAGFDAFQDDLRDHVTAFGKPVVLAHGDFHEYLVDSPWASRERDPVIGRFRRVQTFGGSEVRWIKVRFDPNSIEPFQFAPR